MNNVAIVQARMGSTRLPGKVMLDLGGRSVLRRVVERAGRAKLLQEVIVATSLSPGDEAIAKECRDLGVYCYRGSENDVLDRFYQAALDRNASTVVRITADCPLIDPALIDKTIEALIERDANYASNVASRTYPRGLDVEAMEAWALAQVWREAKKPHQREHVTPYFYEHPELFRLASLTNGSDYSRYRWTLDTAEDFELLKALYAKLDNREDFGWRDAIDVMEKEPRLAELNAGVVQKSVNPH
jgi:spore coat polysaccharide biosynthesis protein SpsF